MTETLENNKDLHFKGQYSGEVTVAFFRAHWIELLPHVVMHLVIFAAMIVLAIIFPTDLFLFFKTSLGQIVVLLGVLLMTYFIHNFFNKLVNHFLSTVILTNLRVVENHKTIFIKDQQVSLDLKVVQDVQKEQNGILENLLNFGELILMMSSSDIHIIQHVPNPNFHFRLLNRVKLEIRQKQPGVKNDEREHRSILFENFSLSREEEREKSEFPKSE